MALGLVQGQVRLTQQLVSVVAHLPLRQADADAQVVALLPVLERVRFDQLAQAFQRMAGLGC